MILESYGDNQKIIAKKNKTGKIHFVLVGSKEQVYSNSLCYIDSKKLSQKDTIDEINQLKIILNEKDMCKKCLKFFKYIFPKYQYLILNH